MTAPERTGKRDLYFSSWIRENLPGSSLGFLVTDLDFVLVDRERKSLLFLEVKTNGRAPATWQKNIFGQVSDFVAAGVMADRSTWTFHGFHVLTFEKTTFADGRAFLDGRQVSEDDVRAFLSMP